MYSTGAIIEQQYDKRDFMAHDIIASGSPIQTPTAYKIEVPWHFYQNGLDSCVGAAVAAAKSVQESRQLSPRHIWAQAKKRQDYKGWGTYIRLALNAVVESGAADYGVLDESVHMDRDEYMRPEINPTVVKSAQENKAASYWRISDYDWATADRVLQETETPIITSMYWHKEYNAPNKHGFLPLPNVNSPKSGHAFVYLGWGIVDGHRVRIFQNSWKKTWGNQGRFYIKDRDIEKYGIKGMYALFDIPKVSAKILANHQQKFVQSDTRKEVYYIDGRTKRHVQNELVFWLFSQESLYEVGKFTQDDLEGIKNGPAVTLADTDPKLIYAMREMAKLYQENEQYAKQLFSHLLS